MTTQNEMFGAEPERLFRKKDPLTSETAASNADNFKSSHEGKIFGVFAGLKGIGCTALVISELTGLTLVQVDRRMASMERHDLVERRLNSPAKNVRDYQSIGGYCIWWAK